MKEIVSFSYLFCVFLGGGVSSVKMFDFTFSYDREFQGIGLNLGSERNFRNVLVAVLTLL
jgi:hypothetical protein